MTKDDEVEPTMVTWNFFIFVIHKHKISESRSSVSTDLPRLNLSDAQSLTSDGLSKNLVFLQRIQRDVCESQIQKEFWDRYNLKENSYYN